MKHLLFIGLTITCISCLPAYLPVEIYQDEELYYILIADEGYEYYGEPLDYAYSQEEVDSICQAEGWTIIGEVIP